MFGLTFVNRNQIVNVRTKVVREVERRRLTPKSDTNFFEFLPLGDQAKKSKKFFPLNSMIFARGFRHGEYESERIFRF